MANNINGLKIRVGVGYDASELIMQYKPAAREIFYSAMDEVAKIGEDTMRSKIERTGSKHARSGLKAKLGFSKPGRIRTGDMYRSVGSRPRGRGKLFQVEVGYLSNPQEYYWWQEYGFTNVWKFFGQSNKPYSNAPNAPAGWLFRRLRTGAPKVAGLFAMRDARQAMDDAMPKIIERAAKRMDKIG